jgi:hypothetical protein
MGGVTTGWALQRFLSPEETWSIDTKIDDGKPNTGKIVIFKYQQGSNAEACSNSSTGEYALQNSGLRCSLIFKDAF